MTRMRENAAAARRRTLLTLGDLREDLTKEAKKAGLKLATYLRHLIVTHPSRKHGPAPR